MFEFDTIERPSMNLNKHWLDYVSLYATKANPVLLSKTERFRQNTSGRATGERERVEKLIKELANDRAVDKKVYDEETIQMKLMEKIDSVADFDINRMNISDIWMGFRTYIWQYVGNEVRSTTYKKNKDMPEVAMIDDNEKETSGEDANLLSTSDILYRQGLLSDEYDDVGYDASSAKKDIIESLEVLNRYNKTKFITTKEKKQLNCLRLLQHEQAHRRLLAEKTRIESIKGSVEKSHLKTVTTSKKNSGSLGLGNKDYFNRTIDTILHGDLIGRRELLHTFLKFTKGMDYFNVDLLWIDADQIVQDDYIQKLKSLLYDSSLVFVSQDELDLLEGHLNFDDFKINSMRDEIAKSKEVNKRDIIDLFTVSNINKIKSIKATELRKISRISKEMINDYVEMIEKNPVLGLAETEKRDTALRAFTAEHYQRMREIEVGILVNGHTIDNGTSLKTLPGILSHNALTVINKSVDSYMSTLLDNDYMKYKEIMLAVGKKYTGKYHFEGKDYNIEEDLNGFYFFKYTDERGETYKRYVQEKVKPIKMTSNDSSIKVSIDKWLVNAKGFMVFKSVDGYLRPGRENVKLWHGSLDNGSAIIIQDVLGNTIPTIL